VAILIVFAILLTRSSEPPRQSILSPGWAAGIGIALVVFGLLTTMILSSGVVKREVPARAEATVLQIGEQLMTKYILPLEVIGLLLTAALIGAVIIAMRDEDVAAGKSE
jgi:NADH-quinone oxidoreductase subunit J